MSKVPLQEMPVRDLANLVLELETIPLFWYASGILAGMLNDEKFTKELRETGWDLIGGVVPAKALIRRKLETL